MPTPAGYVFQEKLFHADHPEPLGNPLNCYASPSPVVEPGRVYVHFGSYGTAALDTKTGAVLWKRSDLPCRHYRGPGSSLVLFENLLILTMDGVDVQYLVALDKETGRTVWKTDRTAEWDDLDADGKPKDEGDLRKAYSTPLIVTVAGDTQMLSVGAKALYGYDPASGRELWKVRTPAFSGAASPIYGQGIAYMISGFGRTELLAIRIEGRGDVTDTNVAWKTGSLVPQTPSPVLVDDLLFMINDVGVLTCLEAASGRQVWRERLRGNFAASLLYADGHVYCFSREGVATVFRAARSYEVLATNVLDAGFMASPAVSGRTLFLRTKESPVPDRIQPVAPCDRFRPPDDVIVRAPKGDEPRLGARVGPDGGVMSLLLGFVVEQADHRRAFEERAVRRRPAAVTVACPPWD